MESTRRNFDPGKFESIHQVGGIRTGRLDWPDAGGSPGCRVAQVDTGSGLRFTVAVDRGGDIVETGVAQYLVPSDSHAADVQVERTGGSRGIA